MALFSILAIIGYSLAFYLLASRLLHEQAPNRSLAALFATLAVISHGVALSQAIFIEDGQNLSLTNTLSLLLWFATLAVTFLLQRMKVLLAAAVIYVVALLTVLSFWLIPDIYITNFDTNPALLSHIILALLAYASLMMATIYAWQLYGINRDLKQHTLQLHPHLPSLMTVERQLFRLILVGYSLLSLSLMTGGIFVDNFLSHGSFHKALFSFAAWVVYSILLYRHHTSGVQIRTTVALTVLGATILTLAYFGSRVVKELILS